MERKRINHISFYSDLIKTMGYDPQNAILEIRLMCDDRIRQYKNVPEYIWYRLREEYHADYYYRRHICGRFAETILPDEDEETPAGRVRAAAWSVSDLPQRKSLRQSDSKSEAASGNRAGI